MSNIPLLTSIEEKKAPFNEPKTPLRGFPVCVTECLSKSLTVTTDNYTWCLEETLPNTDNINWVTEFSKEHYSALELIGVLAELVEKHMPDPIINPTEYKQYQHLLEECKGWESDEFEVYED